MSRISASLVVLLAIISLNFTTNNIQKENYTALKVNPQKSNIKWVAKKIAGQHNGIIGVKNGKILMSDGQLAGGTIFVNMTSIECLDIEDEESNKKLVGHLKSPDFFDTKKYPEAVFKVFTVTPIENNENFTHTIEGTLTIKGYTNDLKFPIKFESKKNQISISGKTDVDRTLYGIKYNSGKFFSDLGDKVIQDNFTLDFKLSFETQEK